jgi:hypothetical protein
VSLTLLHKLAIVLVAFLALLVVVIWFAFRERRLGKTIARDDVASQQASDARVLAVIFSAILGGMILTILTAWLIFF